MKKKNPKISINDYNDKHEDKLGIFLHDKEILQGYNDDNGEQDYLFRYNVVLEDQDRVDHIINGHKYKELLEFRFKCNLKDYIKSIPNKWKDEDDDRDTIEFFDDDKIVKTAQKKKFNYLKKRLRRNYNDVVPEPVEYKATAWHQDDEFLVFTNDTAYAWAGPFVQDGKKGACMAVKKNREEFKFPVLDVRTGWWYTHIPYAAEKRIEELPIIKDEKKYPNVDHYVYSFSPEEKAKFFDEFFTLEEQHQIYKRFIRSHTDKESLECILPYRVYLCGNDDCSYTKWFATQEQADAEVLYLRKMQPLDMNRDIYDRGYIFTN